MFVRKGLILGSFVAAAAALPMLGAPPAQAGNEPYIGWDFGNGVGVGVGTPPSAYDRCPSYGWAYYGGRCHYRAIHYRRHAPRHVAPHPQADQAPTNLGPSDE